MKVFYDKDCDLSLIKNKKVAIIGYGSQGHAHAQNLSESGIERHRRPAQSDGASWGKVEQAGIKVAEVDDAVKECRRRHDLAAGREYRPGLQGKRRTEYAKQGAVLAFAHGFNVHYGQVVPRADLDVIMIAPKAPGHTVRNTYKPRVAASRT